MRRGDSGRQGKAVGGPGRREHETKNHKGNMNMNKKGFTLVEIMIVVLIIGLLAAIAIPSFTRARARARVNTCVNNLRLIDSAKEQLAMEGNLAAATAITVAQVTPFMRNSVMPVCPEGNVAYTDAEVGGVGAPPTCLRNSMGMAHVLPTVDGT